MSSNLPEMFFTAIDNHPMLRAESWFYIQVGKIVGQVNSIEMYINDVISNYYADSDVDSQQRMQTDIINPMTLDLKIALIKKIALSNEVEFSRQNKSDLYKWKEIRNIVAHGVPLHASAPDEPAEMILVYDGVPQDIDRIYKEFFERQARLMSFLKSLQEKLANRSLEDHDSQ